MLFEAMTCLVLIALAILAIVQRLNLDRHEERISRLEAAVTSLPAEFATYADPAVQPPTGYENELDVEDAMLAFECPGLSAERDGNSDESDQ